MKIRNICLGLAVGMSVFAVLGNAASSDACAPLRKACQVAGYKMVQKGATETQIQSLRQSGKDLTFNCVRPVLQGNGATVAGLQMSSSLNIVACKAQIGGKIAAIKAGQK